MFPASKPKLDLYWPPNNGSAAATAARLEVSPSPWSNSAAKRAVDAVAACLSLVLLSPLFVAIGLLIKFDSAGPVFFRQERVGRGFRLFTMYKFRTMIHEQSSQGGLLTLADDPRTTRVGRFLRRTKLDELPQLVNVLLGHMSLVGPRPEVSRYVELLPHEYHEILHVRPGVTDLASVKYRNESNLFTHPESSEREYVERILPDKVALARSYARKASPALDALIIAKTLFGIVRDLGDLRGDRRSIVVLLMSYRRWLVAALHVFFTALTAYVALWVRFDGQIPGPELTVFVRLLPSLIVIRVLTFIPFRLFEGLWRYTSIWDLRNIVGAVFLSTLGFFALARIALGVTIYPRSVYVVDSILLIFLLGGTRLIRRIYHELKYRSGEKRILVFGAGDAGEMIVRDMKKNWHHDYEPIGFVDDDPAKRGQRIHGVPVLGSRHDLAEIIESQKPDEVLIATPAAKPAAVRALVAALEPYKVRITTLPNLRDIVHETVGVNQIRNLSVGDLLERAPIGIDAEPVRDLICGKRVLVTGAGGSIGSELTRQLAALQPAQLILYERYENGLYAIAGELSDIRPGLPVKAAIGDVTDEKRLHAVLAEHRPDLIFHAAAHKHVPLMELNPCEAVKNNVIGTRRVAEAAQRYGVERVILISSDKAVNPSSVMGATKRVAELIHQSMTDDGRTRFLTVRFGNVLGSNGSVVPRFVDQIKAGGPVTVTHPSIRRYFMLIPEAVQLVLHAAALGEAGAVYVLEMGEQIKLLDLARHLIRLAGFVPDEEIPIEFTGLRPGEKLSEELVGEDEVLEPSSIASILRVRPRSRPESATLAPQIALLERLALKGEAGAVLRQLCRIVPTFSPEAHRLSQPAGQPAPRVPSGALQEVNPN